MGIDKLCFCLFHSNGELVSLSLLLFWSVHTLTEINQTKEKKRGSVWIEGKDGLIKTEEVCLYICQHSPWPCPLKGERWEVYVCWATSMHVCVCLCACSMCAGVNNECSWVDWRDTQRPIRALCPAWRAFCTNKCLQTQERCSLSAVALQGNAFIIFVCLCRR